MLTSVHTTRSLRSPIPLRPPEPWAVLLDSLDSIEEEPHIIVVGRDGPELMCALLRAGAPQVTHLHSHERFEADRASLVILPSVSSFDWLGSALAPIRRAMLPNGRLVICCDPLPETERRVRRVLRLHGFITVRSSRIAGRQVLCAEIPSFGLRRSA